MNCTDDGESETLLFNLVYCSRAKTNFTASDIDELLSIARRNNAGNHITGWLVYSSAIFFQWLEGSRDNVRTLMSVIAADPRHDNIIVLSEAEEVRERLFSTWDMELVSAEDIRAVLFDAIAASKDPKSVAALQGLVKHLDSLAVASDLHPFKYRVDEY